MDIEYKTIGLRIKKRRKELKIKQQDLAERLGISNNHLSAIECGREHPSLDTIMSLCLALNVSPDYILFGNMYAYDIPKNIMDSLKLCTPRDQLLVKDIVELLIERNDNGNPPRSDIIAHIR